MAPFGNKNAVGNRGGRPTKYKPEYVDEVFRLALLGLDDAEMASVFDVDEKTLNNWKKEHIDFFQSIKDGREKADAKVARAMYHRAMGYSHDEEKVFYDNQTGAVVTKTVTKNYPPDTAAAFIWLKNRQGKKWRDRQELSIEAGNPIERLSNLLGIPVEVINERLEIAESEQKLLVQETPDYSNKSDLLEDLSQPLSTIQRQVNNSLRSMRKDNIDLLDEQED
jgi:hypothetical protein